LTTSTSSEADVIVVTAEIWPHGNQHAKFPVSTIVIYNDGTGNSDVGNYAYAIGGSEYVLDHTNRRPAPDAFTTLTSPESVRGFLSGQPRSASLLALVSRVLGEQHG
jgi:hypothetical protein